MTAMLARVAVVPVLAAPSLAAEQVTQLVLGEGADLLAADGAMLRIRTVLDRYEGWVHRGYVRRCDRGELEAWLATAAWSEGALLSGHAGTAIRAPHRARVPLEGTDRVRLPDGSAAEILSGAIRPWSAVIADGQREAPAEWAWREFAETPYLWGGVTASGIDCSGLVQITFLARGVILPRDTRDQAESGIAVDPVAMQAGDLLFFRGDETDRITHVAILAAADQIVHSTVETGGVTREPWHAGSRAAPLRQRLVAVRRLT